MNHIPGLGLNKNRLMEPVIKGRNFKVRGTKVVARKVSHRITEKGKIKKETVKLETKYDD